MNIRVITKNDPDFPKCLRNETLYFLGNRSLLKNRLFTITGTKDSDREGISNAKNFATELIKNNVTPVTGFAPGIEKAVADCGECICILPCGLSPSCVYPKVHQSLYKEVLENGGLLLSLETPDTKAAKWTFPKRNKLLAQIGEGVLVVQAGESSDTIRFSKWGRRVYTIPGSISNVRYAGNNILLKTGAKAATSPCDILEDLGINKKETIENTECELTELQQTVLKCLDGESHFEQIMAKTGLILPEVIETVTGLELLGMAEEIKPCIYRKIRR